MACIAILSFTSAQQLIVAQGLDPRSLSPLTTTAQQELNVSSQIVETLIDLTPSGDDFVPLLATSWEQISDSVLRLNLRQGVTFTNGEVFNSEAALFSLNEMLNATAYASFVAVIEGFEIVDEYTIDVIATGATPSGLILHALAQGSFMYPPGHASELGVLTGFGQDPIGTGPFKLQNWVKDDRVTLVANDEYWGGEPDIQTLVFRPIPEASARVAALEAGDIDFAIDIPLDAMTRLEQNSQITTVSAPGGRTFRLTMSMLDESAPTGNLQVRQAVRHAVDADSIIKFVFGGEGQRVSHMLTESMFGYNPDIPYVDYDPERAQELIDESGLEAPVEIRLNYTAGRYPMDKEIGELIGSMLADVGFVVEHNVLESGDFLNQLLDQELEGIFYSGGLTAPDGHFMYVTFTCDFVYAYWCNESFDEVFFEATTMMDEEDRAEAYRELGHLIYEHAHLAPLFTMNDLYAHTDALKGWLPLRNQFLDFRDASLE